MLGCPICNVDGLLTRNFILVVFGLAIFSFVCLLVWAVVTGQFKDVEKPKHRILENEENQEIKK